MEIIEEVNKKLEEKKRFELRYLKDRVIDTLVFLSTNSINGSNLESKLNSVIYEIKRTEAILNGKHDLVLPEEIKQKMYEYCVDAISQNRDNFSYTTQLVEEEIGEYTDFELFNEYSSLVDNDDDETLQLMISIINNDKLVGVIHE